MRISRQQMFMMMAEAAAKRSTCFRLNVGAIIVRDNNVVSIGYNGPASGQPHCSGNLCPGRDRCDISIHAEENAIKRVSVYSVISSDMYVTDSPCSSCAELIRGSGIRRLFFETLYRVNDHLLPLMEYVEIYQVTPSGYVIDYKTREFVDEETLK